MSGKGKGLLGVPSKQPRRKFRQKLKITNDAKFLTIADVKRMAHRHSLVRLSKRVYNRVLTELQLYLVALLRNANNVRRSTTRRTLNVTDLCEGFRVLHSLNASLFAGVVEEARRGKKSRALLEKTEGDAEYDPANAEDAEGAEDVEDPEDPEPTGRQGPSLEL